MLLTSPARLLGASLIAVLPAAAQHFPAHHLFVGDNAAQGAIRFDLTPAEVATYQVGLGARGVAIGPDGNLYVARFNGNRVHVIAPDGTELRQIGAGSPLAGPWGLCFGPRGALYVASATGNRVEVFDAAGAHQRSITQAALDLPRYLAFSADGHLFVSQAGDGGKILEFDAAERYVGEFASGLGAGLGLAFDAEGRLYAATQTNVALYAADGTRLDTIGTGTDLSQPQGLCLAADGHLLVASLNRSSIFEFDAEGDFLREFSGASLGQPHGLATMPQRFGAKLGGVQFGVKSLDVGVASLLPQQGLAMFDFPTDGPLGGRYFVLQGFLGENWVRATQPFLSARQTTSPSALEGHFSVALALSGKLVGERLVIAKAKGVFHGTGESRTYIYGQLALGKALN